MAHKKQPVVETEESPPYTPRGDIVRIPKITPFEFRFGSSRSPLPPPSPPNGLMTKSMRKRQMSYFENMKKNIEENVQNEIFKRLREEAYNLKVYNADLTFNLSFYQTLHENWTNFSDLEELKNEVAYYQMQNAELGKELEELKEENRNLKQQLDDQKMEYQVLDYEHGKLVILVGDLNEEVDHYKRECKKGIDLFVKYSDHVTAVHDKENEIHFKLMDDMVNEIERLRSQLRSR